jgi:hypothetical protein
MKKNSCYVKYEKYIIKHIEELELQYEVSSTQKAAFVLRAFADLKK